MWKSEENLTNWGSDWAQKVGGMIREDRKAAGYTIRELAEKIEISPTHLNRMEKGDRPLDSTKTLVRICDVCHVPVERYLVMFGMRLSEMNTPVRRAFPAVESPQQEEAITTFAKLITSKDLTPENINQMLNTAIAFADFCDKQNQEEKAKGAQQDQQEE